MTARHRVSPSVFCSPRALLDQTSYAFVDSALKDLKNYSRRLKIVLAAHGDELQILERLYYKGKNQHRSGLFWHRAAEIRRYGGRLDGMHISDVVDVFQFSFFGEASQHTFKILKGPWTHFPDVKYVLFVLERLSACFSLVEKMHERLLEASRCFALAMQSGAFIQLVLTLVAIVSRMDILTSELQDALRLTWSAAHRVLQILDAAEAQKSQSSYAPSQQASVLVVTEPIINRRGIDLTLYKDLGSSVTQQNTHFQVSKMSTLTREINPSAAEIRLANDIMRDSRLNVAMNSEPVVRVILERKAVTNASAVVEVTTTEAKRGRGDNAKRSKKAKRKRKDMDEIDDIFGS